MEAFAASRGMFNLVRVDGTHHAVSLHMSNFWTYKAAVDEAQRLNRHRRDATHDAYRVIDDSGACVFKETNHPIQDDTVVAVVADKPRKQRAQPRLVAVDGQRIDS